MPLLTPPHAVLDIASKLEAAGFEAWCVGGAVRDALLGHAHLDWDLATSATPDDVRRVFGHRRTVPVGIQFGTVGVLDRSGVMHEVTTFRRDVDTDGRHAVVAFGVSLEDDLSRRDFTINAIAYSPARDELRDPFDGRADLKRRLVRAVGDPQARMREDRLRALRAIRFAARLGFTVDQPTLEAIRDSAPHLGRLSAERVKQEIDKTLAQVAAPSGAFALWRDTGAFASLVPALAEVGDVWLRMLDHLPPAALPGRPQRTLVRLAGLLASLEPGHASAVLERLKSSRQEISVTGAVLERWRRVRALVADGVPVDASPLARRAVGVTGRLHVGAVSRLLMAAARAGNADGSGGLAPRDVARLHRAMLRAAYRDPVEMADLAVDGDDLRRAGIPAGPALGRILHALLASVIEDPARNRTDWLLHEAARLHAAGPVAGSDQAGGRGDRS
jgi:tRNA nucleotidyltransferase (CCA-adding enzyme)